MPKVLLLFLLAGTAVPAFAAKRVTVEQLEQLLAADRGKPDAKLAQQLSDLELTERLSAARLLRWEANLPGPESRRSLVLLADVSAFLDPPAAEIPATATPDLATQRRMIALAVDHVSKTIRQLPNFFATRDTIRFEDTPESIRPDTSLILYQPLHPVGRSSETVLYRDGREMVDSGTAKGKKSEGEARGLTTSGVFGAILGRVLVDAAHGKLAWSHWEQSGSGPLAVFRYSVPSEKSHYEVEFCCVLGDNGSRVFQQFSGYHGVIAVDPVNGEILRLALEADLKPTAPITRSDILVEYGPVEIGGKTYICPVKSVSITLAPVLPANAFAIQHYRGQLLDKDSKTAVAEHLQTLLNDVIFAQYHVFRSEAHLLTGENVGSAMSQPASAQADTGLSDASPADAGDSGSPAADSKPVQADPVDGTTVAATAESSAEVTARAIETAPAPVENSASEGTVPEISVTQTTGLPNDPAVPTISQPASPDASLVLRVTTRLVDVGVVAFDRKGHPVAGLKQPDFEIYDNGRRQAVRLFSRAGEKSAKESGHAPSHSDDAPDQPVFFNRRAAVADAKPGTQGVEGGVTILLIDSTNLAWADLSYARAEMLKFLQNLPTDERVGLYLMKGRGFQILEEETIDHALLVSKLRQWTPGAQDLARSQELEQRNRQQFDDVRSSTDLEYVNGNINSALETVNPVDPQLRDEGSNPGHGALAILAGVARHLAAIPGHKNLVWVTSDNVLADWTDKAVSGDRGSKHIEGFVLRAQETLNDAHVSVYPLDASQLETQAIDASVKNRNIELSPSVTAPPSPQGGGQSTGRLAAEMQQDLHPIQAAIQEMAAATGGRAFRRSGEISANLNEVVADGRAAYLLGFTPDLPADDQYHLLTVKLVGRRGVTLRYRTGYQYASEPATLKDRFRQAIWQPLDVSEIAVSANPVTVSTGTTLQLNIATKDLALKQEPDRWIDNLDIFLVQRDDEGLHARITGQTLGLKLKPATYEKLLQEGTPFDQLVERRQDAGSIRIVVVDENSGRMGSVTVPAAALLTADGNREKLHRD